MSLFDCAVIYTPEGKEPVVLSCKRIEAADQDAALGLLERPKGYALNRLQIAIGEVKRR